MTRLALIAAGAIALFAANPSQAHDYKKGDLTIFHPWARPAPQGANGAVYLVIKNNGKETDKFVSAESSAAEKTELHETIDDNGVMKMRPLKEGIDLKPGASVELKPGGAHIMLIDLKKGLQEGEMVRLTIKLEKAGAIDVDVKVERTAPGTAEAAPMDTHGMKGMDHSMH